jgi:V8-like Glu-specific endopeptidase
LVLHFSHWLERVARAPPPNSLDDDNDPRIRAADTRGKLKLASIAKDDFVDGEGTVWTAESPLPPSSGEVEDQTDMGMDENGRDKTEQPDPIASKTVEALAEDLRAIRYQDGMMFRQRDLPLELARRIKRSNGVFPHPEGDPGWGGPESMPAPSSGLKTKADGIWGQDNRYIISNTSVYPYRAAGQLVDRGCSAFFIGPRTIVSAAHCFYQRGVGPKPFPTSFVSGRNGGSPPYGPVGFRLMGATTHRPSPSGTQTIESFRPTISSCRRWAGV